MNASIWAYRRQCLPLFLSQVFPFLKNTQLNFTWRSKTVLEDLQIIFLPAAAAASYFESTLRKGQKWVKKCKALLRRLLGGLFMKQMKSIGQPLVYKKDLSLFPVLKAWVFAWVASPLSGPNETLCLGEALLQPVLSSTIVSLSTARRRCGFLMWEHGWLCVPIVPDIQFNFLLILLVGMVRWLQGWQSFSGHMKRTGGQNTCTASCTSYLAGNSWTHLDIWSQPLLPPVVPLTVLLILTTLWRKRLLNYRGL